MSLWYVEEYRCTQVRSNLSPNLHQLNLVLQSPTTPCQFDMWKNADVSSSDVPTKMNPVAHTPATPYEFDMWTHTYEPWCNVPPPKQTQCYTLLLHHVHLTCGSMQTYPNEMYPPNGTQYFRAILHHVHLTWRSMQTYPNEMYPSLIEPSYSEPYYTMSIWHVQACRHTQMRFVLPNWTQFFRVLLHHVCLTCGSMPTYPNEMYPP